MEQDGLTHDLKPLAYIQKFLGWEWSDVDTEMIKGVFLFREFMVWFEQKGLVE